MLKVDRATLHVYWQQANGEAVELPIRVTSARLQGETVVVDLVSSMPLADWETMLSSAAARRLRRL